MILQVLTREDCEEARVWRNSCLNTLRTPFPLTREMQEDFYHSIICNRHSPHRYFGIYDNHIFIGMGGLTYIEWENGQAEISLILDPNVRGKGQGITAVDLLLDHAFNTLRLDLVYGECYCDNPAKSFWEKIVKKYDGDLVTLRKGGKKHGGLIYFDISKCDKS